MLGNGRVVWQGIQMVWAWGGLTLMVGTWGGGGGGGGGEGVSSINTGFFFAVSFIFFVITRASSSKSILLWTNSSCLRTKNLCLMFLDKSLFVTSFLSSLWG